MAKQKKNVVKGKKQPKRSRQRRMMSSVLQDARVAAWDNLLRDPCSAPLAHPCYNGVDSGYLVRTTDVLTASVSGITTAAGADVFIDGFIQITPFNVSGTTGNVFSYNQAGSALPAAAASGYSNFIGTAAVARRYRPVAACVKYIPTGAYAKRAGLVSLGVIPGMEFISGATYTISNVRATCQRYAPNGTEPHEVRWLPTAVDENFTDVNVAINTGAGSVLIVLDGVDGVGTSATTASVSGRFEVTVVWEWIPAAAQGLSLAVETPPPYTSQQVLATIGDIGKYVFQGLRQSRVGQQAMSAAVDYGLRYLTAGARPTVTRPSRNIGY